MRILTRVLLGLGLCMAMLFGIFISNAQADDDNKETIVKFDEPVEVPGHVLLPGTYYFKLADSLSDEDIVQIWTGDHMHILATIMAIPVERLKMPDKTILKLVERNPDSPMAIKTWFYPGDKTGQEFIYSNPHPNSLLLSSTAGK